jgi:2-hydroxy-6-oxonona-2,4-dienedioate hydrolase
MGEMQEGEARAGQSYTDTPARVAFRRFALATVITYVRTASTTFFACPLCRKFACTWWASSHSNALILWDCYPHTSAPGRSSTMKSHSRHVLPAALAVLAFLAIASVAAGIGIALPAYRADLSAARERATMSQIAQTPCGPIEYSSVGQGDPVLVVHGAGGGFDQGQYFAAPLAAHGFRVIAMSRCGYLRTPLAADSSAEAQAAAHACLLDALQIGKAAVLGASAGAPSAIQFALRTPQRLAALILLVPAAYVPRPQNAASMRTPVGTQWMFDTALKSDLLYWTLTRIAPQTLTRTILATPPELVARSSPDEQRRIREVLGQILPVSERRRGLINDAAVVSSLPRYDLERVAAPTLVISTQDDLYGTFDVAKYTAQHIPGARFIGYATGGHLLVGRQPEVMTEIETFLKLHCGRNPPPAHT